MLPAELEPYLEAFFELSPGRQVGFEGPGGIPMADLVAYCQLFDIENAGRFVEYMRSLDGEFLRFAAERSKAAS